MAVYVAVTDIRHGEVDADGNNQTLYIESGTVLPKGFPDELLDGLLEAGSVEVFKEAPTADGTSVIDQLQQQIDSLKAQLADKEAQAAKEPEA